MVCGSIQVLLDGIVVGDVEGIRWQALWHLYQRCLQCQRTDSMWALHVRSGPGYMLCSGHPVCAGAAVCGAHMQHWQRRSVAQECSDLISTSMTLPCLTFYCVCAMELICFTRHPQTFLADVCPTCLWQYGGPPPGHAADIHSMQPFVTPPTA